MKALKLILIAVIVAGAIAGLFFLTKGGKSKTSGGRNDELFNQLQDEMAQAWDDSDTWDKDLFYAQITALNQNQDELGSGYETLLDMVARLANDHLYDDMMGEFAKADCDKEKISQFDKDLKYFLDNSTGYANHEKVKTMQETSKLYKSILSFVESSKKDVAPRFDFDAGTWTDFDSYYNGVLKQRDDYKANRYFGHISNISLIVSGLGSIETNLRQVKSNFTKTLAHQIINAYDKEEKSDDMRKSLENIHSRFHVKFGSQKALDDYVLYY